MHPNLRNTYPKGYYFVEGKGSVVVKGLPFRFSFRQSDEALRFGRASYFKLSFDAQAYSKQNIAGLKGDLNALDAKIAEKQKLLYALEAKWSYLYQKKKELDALKLSLPEGNLPHFGIPDSLPDLPTIPSIPTTPSIPSIPDSLQAVPTVPSLPSIPDYGLALDSLSGQIGAEKLNLGKLKEQQLGLKQAYSKALSKIPLDFMSGIRKMDFGLTSLGKSSMSKNAVPIQGVHVMYEGENYFTDVAAGYTLPSQLFSNQAFDQVLYNSGNIFNMGDFFQVNNVRFVSSAKAGYGKENGNHIAVENFYSGKALHKNDAAASGDRAFTSNVTSRFSPARWKNFTWVNTVGYTFTTPQPDSASAHAPKPSAGDRIALFSSATVQFPKVRSSLESSYRRIPSAYDGFTQGIYLKQTERTEVIYRQAMGRRLRTALRMTRDLFFLQNGLNSSRLINQVGMDLQLKMSKSLVLTGNYSLLQLQERAVVSPRSDVSHLGRLGAVSTHEVGKGGKHEFTTLHDISYARINGFDSAQTLFQGNAKYALQMTQWKFGLQMQYSEFSGLTKLYGRNVIIQPEIGLKLEHLYFTASYQQLWSEQFDRDYGMQFRTGFVFSEYVDCDLTMQRFLPTEYKLFIDPSLEYQKPFYVKFGVNVHL